MGEGGKRDEAGRGVPGTHAGGVRRDRRGEAVVSELVRARVQDNLERLRLGHVAQRLDAILSEAARGEPTYMDFLDGLLREEVDSKQRKRVQMGLTIAHFPQARTLEEFDFRFQPSVDQRLVKELATARFLSQMLDRSSEMTRVCLGGMVQG
ncbi:MAG: ATP-binding protein [Acidobacteria bacterium]|nr:ATP-binding protein [Acidobacteriota bacterium]